MVETQNQKDLILHAAMLIENNASELQIAFANPQGKYYLNDVDISAEINDMHFTVIKLRSLVIY